MLTKQRTIYILIVLIAAVGVFNITAQHMVCDDFYWSLSRANTTVFYPGMLLGDLAPIVADYLVIKAGQFWHEGRWYLMPVIYTMVVNVQPSYIDYWSLLGWLYAFNNAAMVSDEHKEAVLIQKGIKVLQKGVAFHPAAYELYFDIAWTYFKKQGDLRRALLYLERAERHAHPLKVERLKAITLFRLGRHADARAVWENYVAVHPEDEEVRGELERLEKLV
ncbi:MAG: hypothetical protein JW938_04500 [Candidatus Omnitrophica bacterium]|nr:hypothetical protein [Candidatus Omnitrophota bacterium]